MGNIILASQGKNIKQQVNKLSQNPQIVGSIDQNTIDLINNKLGKSIGVVPSDIIIGPTNIEHIKNSHKDVYDNYLDEIPNVIANADYITIHPSGKSIEYIKECNPNLLVAVRVKSIGPLWVKSFFTIEDFKLKQYISSGTVIKL
jgi:hypothetical protein